MTDHTHKVRGSLTLANGFRIEGVADLATWKFMERDPDDISRPAPEGPVAGREVVIVLPSSQVRAFETGIAGNP